MNKVLMSFVIVVMILVVGVFADSGGVEQEIRDFVEESRGIVVSNITEVDFSDLPDEVDIEKIENTSIVIYEVDYGEMPLFVITSSGIEKSVVSAPVCDAKLLLHFGFSEEMAESGFLNMASGVQGSLEKGYVMLRDGSVTGISTNLEVVSSVAEGGVEVVIYKNGVEVGFRNYLGTDSSGVEIDYDVQSKGIVNFKAGDVISVYLSSEDGVVLADVTTVIEVTG
jgi:hypothetical protein